MAGLVRQVLVRSSLFQRCIRLNRCSSSMYSIYCRPQLYSGKQNARSAALARSLPGPPVRHLRSTTAHYGNIMQFMLSDIGEGITEVTVKEWYVSEGDNVAQFDSICEVQSDKASVTITSRFDGVITKMHYEVDETAIVGKPLVDIEVASEGRHDAVEGASSSDSDSDSDSGTTSTDDDIVHERKQHGRVLATPAVKRLAMEYDISLLDVSGTGKDGRVLKEDMLAYVDMLKGEATPPPPIPVPIPPPTSPSSPPPSPPVTRPFPPPPMSKDRTEPIRGVRKAMVKSMTATTAIPHFSYSDEVDVTALIPVVDSFKEMAAQRDVKFSMMPVFIKAASMALQYFPILNASLDDSCENITYKSSHNIGVAMDTPNGLLVPNIKNVEGRTMFEVAQELNRLRTLAYDGKLTSADLVGCTFGLSNFGMIGGTYARPVLIPGTVAIGGIGKIQAIPRFDEHDEIYKASIMSISWSADHRIIDGATMARFSNIWKAYLEKPATMTLDLK